MNIKRIVLFLYVLSTSLLFTSNNAQAALIKNGSQLIGATDVLVNGVLYDVAFTDGTCKDLFTGCNDSSDFLFPTKALADMASQALFDQVLIDGPDGQFDSKPQLTNGCSSSGYCDVYTPYSYVRLLYGPYVYSSTAINTSPNVAAPVEGVYFGEATITQDFSEIYRTWAVWTVAAPVPVPPAFPMFVTGLLFLGLVRSPGRFKSHTIVSDD